MLDRGACRARRPSGNTCASCCPGDYKTILLQCSIRFGSRSLGNSEIACRLSNGGETLTVTKLPRADRPAEQVSNIF